MHHFVQNIGKTPNKHNSTKRADDRNRGCLTWSREGVQTMTAEYNPIQSNWQDDIIIGSNDLTSPNGFRSTLDECYNDVHMFL